MSGSYEKLRRVFGRNFRRMREKVGRSQGMLAKEAGIPQATLSDVEAGSVNLTRRTMVKLADAVNSAVPALLEERKD